MIVNIDELRTLPQQKLILSFKESIDNIDAVKPVLGEFTLVASTTGIRITGQVQTLLKLTCDRCLRPYFLNISLPIEDFFREQETQHYREPEKMPRERELTAEDFQEELTEEGNLDITDLVYQAVTLATPVSHLCGDDCPGPAFPDAETKSSSLAKSKDDKDKDHPIDPRWKNLKTLFPKEESE